MPTYVVSVQAAFFMDVVIDTDKTKAEIAAMTDGEFENAFGVEIRDAWDGTATKLGDATLLRDAGEIADAPPPDDPCWDPSGQLSPPLCPHANTTEGVDGYGRLIEPAYDVCVDCGEKLP